MKLRFIADIPEERYDLIYNSKNKNYKIVCKNLLWGVIDSEGREIIPTVYKDIDDFAGDHIPVKGEDGWGLVDINNTIKMPLEGLSIKSIKMGENFFFLSGKKNEFLIFSSMSNYLITIPSEHSEQILNYDNIYQLKVLGSNILVLTVEKLSDYSNIIQKYPIYLIESKSNLKILKINESAYTKITSKINNINKDVPKETEFFIEKVFGDFVSVKFLSNISFGALCKLQNGELIPMIPYGNISPLTMNQTVKSLVNSELNKILGTNYYDLDDTHGLVNFVTIGNKSYILVKEEASGLTNSTKSMSVYNLDGSVFISDGFIKLYVSKYAADDVIGLKKDKVVYIDSKTGKEHKEIKNFENLEKITFLQSPISGIYIEPEGALEEIEKKIKENEFRTYKISNFDILKDFLASSKKPPFYFVDAEGKKILENKFSSARFVSTTSGKANLIFGISEEKIIILNEKGRILNKIDVTHMVFRSADMNLKSKLFPVDLNGGIGLSPTFDDNINSKSGWFKINIKDGGVFENRQSTEFPILKNQVIIVCKDSKIGILNSNFNVIVPLIYDDLRYSYDDRHDNYVVVKKYDGVHNFQKKDIEDLVKTLRERELENQSPSSLLKDIIDSEGQFSTTGTYGIINIKNEPVLPFIFEDIEFLDHQAGTIFRGIMEKKTFPINKNTIYNLGKKLYKIIIENPRDYFLQSFINSSSEKSVSLYGIRRELMWKRHLDSLPENLKNQTILKNNPTIFTKIYETWSQEAARDFKIIKTKAEQERKLNKSLKQKEVELESTPVKTNLKKIFKVTQKATGLTAEIEGEGNDYLECRGDVESKLLKKFPESTVEDYLIQSI